MKREIEESYISKFDSPITAFIHDRVVMEGLADELFNAEGSGDWYARVGRRLIFGDSQGFVYSMKFRTVNEAISEMEEVEAEYRLMEEEEWS